MSARPASCLPLILLLLLCGLGCAHAESDDEGVAGASADAPPAITGAALEADLLALYRGLQAAHYDLYADRSADEYDAEFAASRAAIRESQSRLDAWRLLQRFTAFGNIAHANIAFPAKAYGAFRAAGGRTLPIYPRIDAGRIYVRENYSSVRRISAGDEILSIDGEPAGLWLERTASYLSADTPRIAHSLLEGRFPAYLWLVVGDRSRFTLRVRSPGSRRVRRVRVGALTGSELEAAIESAPKQFELDYTERVARMQAPGIAYLRPGPFYNAEQQQQLWDSAAFESFIDDAFADFQRAAAHTLIIDLRTNPGGDNSFSDHLVAYLADRPFRFASRFVVRSSAQAEAANRARLDAGADLASVSARYAAAYAKTPHGQTFDFEIPWGRPRTGKNAVDRPFGDRVYALIDRNSYSNAVNVAAILQDYGWAIIAGEPTTDYATTLGAMERFTLPNTGFSVGFPKALIVRPSGDERRGGVVPDLPIPRPPTPGATDAVLAALLSELDAATSDR
ncbi:MAG: S41 family peptidase [Pseudomonadota bacterium]